MTMTRSYRQLMPSISPAYATQPLVSWPTTPKPGVIPDQPAATLQPIHASGQFQSVGTSRATHAVTTVSSTGVPHVNLIGHGLGAKPSINIRQPVTIKQQQMFTFGPHPSTISQQPQQQQQQPYPYSYPPPLIIRLSPQSQNCGPPAGARNARGKSASSLQGGYMRYGSEKDKQFVAVLKSQRLREALAQAQETGSAHAGRRVQGQSQGQLQKRPQSSTGASSHFGAVGYGRPSKNRKSILSPLTIEPPK